MLAIDKASCDDCYLGSIDSTAICCCKTMSSMSSLCSEKYVPQRAVQEISIHVTMYPAPADDDDAGSLGSRSCLLLKYLKCILKVL